MAKKKLDRNSANAVVAMNDAFDLALRQPEANGFMAKVTSTPVFSLPAGALVIIYNFVKDMWQRVVAQAGEFPKVEKIFIPRAFARYCLDNRNLNNRAISHKQKSRLVFDIDHGRWVLTNSMIAFTREGYVADGGHRLSAIAESSAAGAWCYVMWGCDPRLIEVVDSHRNRTLPDVVRMMNLRDSAGRPISLRAFWAGHHIMENSGADRAARSARLDFYRCEELMYWANEAGIDIPYHVSKVYCKPGVVGAYTRALYFYRKDRVAINRLRGFAGTFVKADSGAPVDDPAIALRRIIGAIPLEVTSHKRRYYWWTEQAIKLYMLGQRVTAELGPQLFTMTGEMECNKELFPFDKVMGPVNDKQVSRRRNSRKSAK